MLFITLTVAIDYQRDANLLWANSRATFEDPETRFLFDPAAVHAASSSDTVAAMTRHGLAKKPRNDAFIWTTVAVSFLKKWRGDPRLFLGDCGWEAPTVLQRLKAAVHPRGGRDTWDFPFLRGDKIGPLWLRMLRDNVGLGDLTGLDAVPIPVDIHVARATLALGLVRGQYQGHLSGVFPQIREAWAAAVHGLAVKGRPMIALDVDEPLWHLSKYGCTSRPPWPARCPRLGGCEATAYCVEGQVKVGTSSVEIDT